MTFTYGSLFSGIEGASVAWTSLGWDPLWFSEIDKFPCQVLKYHYPNVPNLGDIKSVDWRSIEPVKLIIGGSPCQSFSVAGKRLGMDDPRGNLALEYLNVVNIIKPDWFVFENVSGLLTSNKGKDFGALLWEVEKLGYGWAYATLDAKHFGIPQQRRRVFIVGYHGNWRYPAATLFNRRCFTESLPKLQRIWPSFTGTLTRNIGKKLNQGILSVVERYITQNHFLFKDQKGIRKPTVTELERLQGFPDGYTDIPFESKNKNKLRGMALGNSFAVPVVRWIGERIHQIETLKAQGVI